MKLGFFYLSENVNWSRKILKLLNEYPVKSLVKCPKNISIL